MGVNTKIETFDSTWSPITGCFHGCEYCYARGIAERFGGWNFTPGMGKINVSNDKTYICPGKDYYGEVNETEYGIVADITDPFLNERGKCAYPFGFTPTFHRYRLNDYIEKKGRNIFVCSMADLFGSWVPDSWIEEVFKACEKAPQHNYLFLTKNPQRYVDLGHSGKLPQKDNMWYGSTVTTPNTEAYWGRNANTFWSIEPILEPFGSMGTPYNETPKWVIIGAETGRRKNKVIPDKKWIEDIVMECRNANIPVFMKSSIADIWGEPLIQEFPVGLRRDKENE